MALKSTRLGLAALLTGTALVAAFMMTVLRLSAELRREIRQKIIERDAAVLHPVALRQLAEQDGAQLAPADLLLAVLQNANQDGMLAVTVFDEHGEPLKSLPGTLLFPELSPLDQIALGSGKPVSRFHPDFVIANYFRGAAGGATIPVLEVLLPLHGRNPAASPGYAQYYMDARPLARELATIDQRVTRQTVGTLVLGCSLIVATIAAAYLALRRAAREVAERNERLTRANFELTLAAKASALGQITSHLIHGLQGPVAGLRAAVAHRDASDATSSDWRSAADYAERVQSLIQETVSLLGDAQAGVSYELNGHELAAIIAQRNQAAAQAKGARLVVGNGFAENIDSHRGSVLCLIATNLVQNSIAATPAGDRVEVELRLDDDVVLLRVADEGPGIAPEIRHELFKPGQSGRTGGTGLGLAISRLLARQINAELALDSTGPDGTIFSLRLPLAPSPIATPPR